MKVGDLVRIIYDDTIGIVTRIKGYEGEHGVRVWLHTGESFRPLALEVISES